MRFVAAAAASLALVMEAEWSVSVFWAHWLAQFDLDHWNWHHQPNGVEECEQEAVQLAEREVEEFEAAAEKSGLVVQSGVVVVQELSANKFWVQIEQIENWGRW